MSALTELQKYTGTPDPFVPADCSQADADSLIELYNLTHGWNWTTKTNWLSDTTVNNWAGITVAGGRVTEIDLGANAIFGNLATWTMPTALTRLSLYSNSGLYGDISSWTLASTLDYLYLYSTGASGDVSSWILPDTLTRAYLYGSDLEGDISSWTLPAMQRFLIMLTDLYGTPDISSNTAMADYRQYNCGLTQSNVDDILASVYARRASFTNAAPNLEIHGTNATPSGTYQDGDPPTTGKEYAYELENDPETEGFNVWTISFTP